jgi:predicted HicB family RNase H-like nuclease
MLHMGLQFSSDEIGTKMNLANIEQLIDKQIDTNYRTNIFEHELASIDSKLITGLKKSFLSEESKKIILEYCTAYFMQKLIKYNQYISFTDDDVVALRNVYKETLEEIIHRKRLSKKTIENNHFLRIKAFLLRTNPFLKEISKDGIKTFANEEYSASFQMEILGLDKHHIVGPILDIGCGQNFNLVKHLKELEVEVYGLDRYASKQDNILKANFLSFDYGVNKWQFILSNMAFSNHFNRHLAFNDEKVEKYATVYFKILNSLKVGGKFIYAPSIIEIEKLLDKKKFSIINEEIGYGLFRTIIEKLTN